MGVLSKLFRRGEEQRAPAAVESATCPHTALTARWDNLEDIGKEDRASSFRCESCGATFSGDEGRRMLRERGAGTVG
jgi:transposase-like protein